MARFSCEPPSWRFVDGQTVNHFCWRKAAILLAQQRSRRATEPSLPAIIQIIAVNAIQPSTATDFSIGFTENFSLLFCPIFFLFLSFLSIIFRFSALLSVGSVDSRRATVSHFCNSTFLGCTRSHRKLVVTLGCYALETRQAASGETRRISRKKETGETSDTIVTR